MNVRAYIITANQYEGAQRKIAWFNRLKNGLYFDFPFLPTGSHISFHKDGSIWRTSISTGRNPEKTGYSLPLDDKSVWAQLGISVFRKEVINNFPRLKKSDIRKNIIYEIDFTQFPSDTPNFVVECIHSSILDTIPSEMHPPDDANVIIIDEWEPNVVITILGHKHNQLIHFENGIVKVHHFNDRFSANRPGITYNWEAIGEK